MTTEQTVGWRRGSFKSCWRPRQLLVDDRHWPEVAERLQREGIRVMRETTTYGLVRLELGGDLDLALDLLHGWYDEQGATGAHPFGRNRFFAVDDDSVSGTPKTFGSQRPGRPVPTADRPPGRDPVGPGRGVTVGTVDTGYRYHYWLEGACQYDRPADDAIDADHDLLPDLAAGHGTFIAGLVLQQAPGAIVRVRRAIDTVTNSAESIDVHDRICELVDLGTDIVVLALGCVTDDDREPFVLRHAVDYAVRGGTLLVASAGNGGSDRPFWPAACPAVWSVEADRQAGDGWERTDYSGYGSWVDLAAPGDRVVSTLATLPVDGDDRGGWASWSGASFAAGVAAGWLAARKGEWLLAVAEPTADGRPERFLGPADDKDACVTLRGLADPRPEEPPLVGIDRVRVAQGGSE
jgi:Subtilase family